ncbi:MAG: hypothetical protein QOE70_2620 [Chthoniobacter sp.]|jgi:outer membrane lipoprotein SlyB|nr:hypothetical protein [Chthoniobacter sp.]
MKRKPIPILEPGEMISKPFRPRAGARLLSSIVLCCAVCSCANIKNDRTRTRTEGAAAGAAGGALLGAGLGWFVGQSRVGAMAGGAIGGALFGASAGAAYGDRVASRKEGYVRTEDALEARLRSTKQQIATRRSYNSRLRGSIARKEQQLATVLATDRSEGPTVGEFDLRTSVNTQLGEVDQRARSWQETIDAHKTALARVGADPRKVALKTDIDGLSTERQELERQRERLSSINSKLNR